MGATTTNAPDFTFLWDASPDGRHLLVRCRFGSGTSTGNVATARVPLGDVTPVQMENHKGNNPAISVDGTVQVLWGADAPPERCYVARFTGLMIQPGVNNVFSSNQVAGPEPIIVAASII